MGRPALLFVLHEVKRLSGRRKCGVAETVRKFAVPYAEKLGLSIWDVRYVREGGSNFLRIYIDRAGGVGIDDCEKMSRAVNGPLDELDPIAGPYCLEVSSPGVNRLLTRPEHFQKYLGATVAVRLIRPLADGRRDLTGKLRSYGDGGISVSEGSGGERELSRKDIASVRLAEDDFLEETKT